MAETKEEKLLRLLQKIQEEQGKLLMHKDWQELDEQEQATLGGFFGQMFLGAVNSAAIGAPRFIADKDNKGLFKPSESKTERVGRGIGTAIGFVAGAPLRIFSAATKASTAVGRTFATARGVQKGTPLATKAAAKSIDRTANVIGTAGGFGASTAVEFPDAEESFGDKVFDVPISTALGAAFGLATPIIVNTVKKNTKTIKEIADGILPKEAMKGIGERFSKDMVAVKQAADTKLNKLIESKQWKSANEFIHKTYEGSVQNTKSLMMNVKKSKAMAKSKEFKDRVLSTDFVRSMQAELEGVVGIAKKSQFWKDLSEMSRKGAHNFIFSTGASHIWKNSFAGKRFVAASRAVEQTTKATASPLSVRMMNSLGALSKEDYALFQRAIEDPTLVTPSIKNAVNLWTKTYVGIGKELQSAGFQQKTSEGRLIPLRLRKNYFPHQQIDKLAEKSIQEEVLSSAAKREGLTRSQIQPIWDDWNKWLEGNGTKNGAMVNFLIKKRGFASKDAAVKTLSDIVESRMSPLFKHHDYRNGLSRGLGSVDYTRPTNLPFYDIDPKRALARYIYGSKRRLAEAQQFGANDEKLIKMIGNMKETGGDARLVHHLVESLRGVTEARPAWGFISQKTNQTMRGVEVITKLGTSSIANASQSVSTAIFTDIQSTAKSLAKYLSSNKNRKLMQEQASNWGVTYEGGMSELMQGLGSDGSFTILGKSISPSKFLQRTGFLWVERMNRVVAAHAAKDFAIRMSKELTKDPSNKVIQRSLRRMGINWKSVLGERGNLNVGQIARAARETEAKTQFQTGLLDIPLWWNSPEGKLVTQFKVFSYKQAQLLKTVIIDEARKGNMKPLLTALALMPIIGEGVKDARSIVTLRKRNDKGLNRLAENMAAVGAGGIFSDILQQNKFGNIESFLVGPVGSDVGKAIQAGIKAGQGKTTKAENFLLKNIPIAGPALQNLRRNPTGNPKDKLEQVLSSIL
jgi:hypothetical protein